MNQVGRTARLTAAAAVMLSTLICAGPALAATAALVNQVGYDTKAPKTVRVQSDAELGGAAGTFAVIDTGGKMVFSGALEFSGPLWGKFYWRGDFTALETTGRYTIRTSVGGQTDTSFPFIIEPNILFRATGDLAVKFFSIQRCGTTVPGWHGLCHRDDCKRLDGTHGDHTGGWHDAGDYGKFPAGFHPPATFALLYAYEERADEWDAPAYDTRFPNGVPDIIDEAIWGLDFERKCVAADGHVFARTVRHKSGSSFVAPEVDTDNKIGTSDDRTIEDDPDPNGRGVLVAGSLAKLWWLSKNRLHGVAPRDEDIALAERIWDYYWSIGPSGHPYGDGMAQVFSAMELYRATGKDKYRDYAIVRARDMGWGMKNNPAFYDTDWLTGGMDLGVLGTYLEKYPGHPDEQLLKEGLVAAVDHVIDLAANPMGLESRVNKAGAPIFFIEWDAGVNVVGQNPLYASTAWGANMAYRMTGDPKYHRFAMDQLNWILGANWSEICMMHGVGSQNLKGYHHRYYKIPGHTDGAVPGAVPNGYTRPYDNRTLDIPWIDLAENSTSVFSGYLAKYESNEPWLPNNLYYLLALVTLPYSQAPQTDGGVPDTGTPDTGHPDAGTPDTGAPDAGHEDAGVPDGGLLPDGTVPDGGVVDAGTSDAAAPDAAAADAGPHDASSVPDDAADTRDASSGNARDARHGAGGDDGEAGAAGCSCSAL